MLCFVPRNIPLSFSICVGGCDLDLMLFTFQLQQEQKVMRGLEEPKLKRSTRDPPADGMGNFEKRKKVSKLIRPRLDLGTFSVLD